MNIEVSQSPAAESAVPVVATAACACRDDLGFVAVERGTIP